jgi:hypothetical protein
MKEKGERGNRGGGLVRKREKGTGFWPNGHLPPLARTPDRGRGELGRWRPAGLSATTADGERGKRRRATRGIFSLPHLGLERAVEAAPRGGGGGDGLRWWLDVAVRRGKGGAVVVRWCGEDGAGLFIAGTRSVQGKIFVLTGAPARSRRPTEILAAGDGTARAE